MRPGPIDPLELEPIAARAWPAAREGRIGGWRIYASSGYSGRINACWPLADPGLGLADAIAAVEAWYAERSLPPLFKIIDGGVAPAGLHEALERLGYRARTETLMMVAPMGGGLGADAGVSVTDRLDEAFAAVFAAAGSGDPGDARERLEALGRIAPPRAFARLDVDGEAAAIGACAIDGSWAGVFAMRTDPRHRRQGLARRILGALMARAGEAGATRAYLQVEADNEAALSLYRAAGFAEAYRYRYWGKSDQSLLP